MDYYFLSIRSQNVAGFIGLNDAWLIVDPSGRGVATELPVNAWLMPRDNTINIQLEEADRAPFAAGTPSLELSFYLADPQKEYPTPAQVLWHYQWPADADDERLPFMLKQNVAIPRAPKTKVWHEAAVNQGLGSADKSAILQMIESFRGKLLDGRFNQAYQMMAYRYQEEAVAEGKAPDRFRPVVLEQYQMLRDSGPLSSQPLLAQDAHFRIVAGGRLVQVTQRQFQPAVRINAPTHEMAFAIPIFAARVNQSWLIAR